MIWPSFFILVIIINIIAESLVNVNVKEICFLDIPSIGKMYRQKTLSPVELTKMVFDRIHQYDSKLNAFITLLENSALQQARQAEAEFARGNDRGPLTGIPISLKDIIDLVNVKTTAAARILKDNVAAESAFVTKRLVDAGAIIIGKCNLLEFAYGNVHPDFGKCNNAWDPDRTSGGSSSGSAKSVAAGMGFGSLGTDTGGSIRIPASYCGIVGFKPTYGRVSRRGVHPLSWSLDHVGTLSRTVEDTAILLQIIAGYDPMDPGSANESLPDYKKALTGDVSGLRLGVVEQHLDGCKDLRPGVADKTWEAIKILEKAGMKVQKINIKNLEYADTALLVAIFPEATVIHQDRLRERPQDFAEMTRQQLEMGALLPAVDYVRVQQYRSRLLNQYLQVFKDVDVLISPTVFWEAPKEDPAIGGDEGAAEARRTAPYNLTGLPAISVPCGFGVEGMPLGLQVIGPPMQEEVVLKVAHAYEQRCEWYKQHPLMT